MKLKDEKIEKSSHYFYNQNYIDKKRSAKKDGSGYDITHSFFKNSSIIQPTKTKSGFSASNLQTSNTQITEEKLRQTANPVNSPSKKVTLSNFAPVNPTLKLNPPVRKLMPVLEPFFPEPKAYKKIPLYMNIKTSLTRNNSIKRESKPAHRWSTMIKLRPEESEELYSASNIPQST